MEHRRIVAIGMSWLQLSTVIKKAGVKGVFVWNLAQSALAEVLPMACLAEKPAKGGLLC